MVFKFHFALWCGGLIGVSPYELFQFEKEYFDANVHHHTILFTILPLSLMIFKPLFSLLADHYRAHHHILLLSLMVTLLGYGSLAAFPFVPDLLAKHKELAWTLFCLANFVGNTSMGIVNSLADSMAVHAADKKNEHYSKYRVWGPVGFGIFGAVWTLVDKLPIAPKYTPGIFLFVVLHSLNIILLAYKYDREELRIPHWHFRSHHGDNHEQNQNNINDHKKKSEREGLKNGDFLYQVEQRVEMELKTRIRYLRILFNQEKSIYLYLLAFTFCGMSTGFQFQFMFNTLNELGKSTKSGHIETLVALVIIVQAVGGELIFFLFAEPIIKKLGNVITLALSFASYGARHLIYAFWTPTNSSIYLILLVELLQGPAFGLMYCVLTHKAHDYSLKVDQIINLEHDPSQTNQWTKKNILHATLQGILGGSYDGLGLALGIAIGGKLYSVNPHEMWLIAGLTALLVATLTVFGRATVKIYRCIKKQNNRSQTVLVLN